MELSKSVGYFQVNKSHDAASLLLTTTILLISRKEQEKVGKTF
jgi:hypothetical protein